MDDLNTWIESYLSEKLDEYYTQFKIIHYLRFQETLNTISRGWFYKPKTSLMLLSFYNIPTNEIIYTRGYPYYNSMKYVKIII